MGCQLEMAGKGPSTGCTHELREITLLPFTDKEVVQMLKKLVTPERLCISCSKLYLSKTYQRKQQL
jgi:hypothetical protein